jgi:hypothetical protein
VPAGDVPAELQSWCRNPIDQFVVARLAQHQLTPAPPCSRRTLIRRLYFDLIGMPPTPEEVAAFVADESPSAYERLVDRLLASPRYGERWARHWMDLVHFAETHGHDQDRIREHAWPYRDYLIHALNDDLPYASFVRQQIAGDVLFADDPRGVVATGMLAAGPWDESSLRDIQEDSVDRDIARYLDRDDIVTTVMTTFCSTSVHCARCHDHKFDPISQQEYYGLQAVFAGIGKGNRLYDPQPDTARRRRDLQAQLDNLQQQRRCGEAVELTPELTAELRDWEAVKQQELSAWQPLQWTELRSAAGASIRTLDDGSFLAEGPRPDKDVYYLAGVAPTQRITAVRLELLPDPSLPMSGPGRADNGNCHLNHVRIFQVHDGKPVELSVVNPRADFNQQDWEIDKAVDGNPNTAWGIHPQVGIAHTAVFEVQGVQPQAEGVALRMELHQIHGGAHLLGRWRLRVTDQPPPAPVSLSSLDPEIIAVLQTEPGARTVAHQAALAAYFLEQRARRELDTLPAPQLVYCGTSRFEADGSFRPTEQPRTVMVLRRGMIDAPMNEAHPVALACLTTQSGRLAIADLNDEGQRRAALAEWIASPDNVLTARSIVNRLWQHHFGRGLVDTPNDFGLMGAPPTHPRLLDWLAASLLRYDGSLKSIQRLIVTSATYQQSVVDDEAARAIDADNRLLWRFNRRRLDAESVRDALLVFSGQLDLTMGGPSDQNFIQSPGVHVTPVVDYEAFDVSGQRGARRSVYRFLFRTIPDPFMEALDCPDASQLTGQRSESITPLQALATLHDQFVIHHCQLMADRLQGENADQVASACRALTLILGRPPDPHELTRVQQYVESHGLANACRFLMNTNEFMFVE